MHADQFKIIIDKDYTTPTNIYDATIGVIATSISDNLASQLMSVSKEGAEPIDLNAKLYYKTTFDHGTICELNK